MHAGACGRAAYPGQQTEGAVRAARFGESGKDQDDPLRSPSVVHERGRAQLSALLLQEDAKPALDADEAGQEPRPARDRTRCQLRRKRRGHDRSGLVQRDGEKCRDTAKIERGGGPRRH